MRVGPQLRVHTIHLKVQSGQQYKNQTPSGRLLVGERTTSTPVKSLHFARNPIKTRPQQTAKGGAGHFFFGLPLWRSDGRSNSGSGNSGQGLKADACKAKLRWLPSQNEREDFERRSEAEEASHAQSHAWKAAA